MRGYNHMLASTSAASIERLFQLSFNYLPAGYLALKKIAELQLLLKRV